MSSRVNDEKSPQVNTLDIKDIAAHIAHVVLTLGEAAVECEKRCHVAWILSPENERAAHHSSECALFGLRRSSTRTSECPLHQTLGNESAAAAACPNSPEHVASPVKAERIPLFSESRSSSSGSTPEQSQSQKQQQEPHRNSSLCLFRRPRLCDFGVPEQMFVRLVEHVCILFSEEPLLLTVSTPVVVCGDLHGQLHDLVRILETFGLPGPLPGQCFCGSAAAAVGKSWWTRPIKRFVGDPKDALRYLFLGDYVDRGRHSLEVLALLFALKTLCPERVLLLRGNHESPRINEMYNFRAETIALFSSATYERIVKAFDVMPVAAILERSDAAAAELETRKRRAFAAHGGVSDELKDLKELNDSSRFARPFDVPAEGPVCDLIWSDPAPRDFDGYLRDNPRGVSKEFGTDAIEEFIWRHDISYVLRAHQYKENGFEKLLGGRFVSLFSASNYMGRGNRGAVCYVHTDLATSFFKSNPLGCRDVQH